MKITLPDYPTRVVGRAETWPGEIEVDGPFIACAGGIDGHTDPHFPPWSAFLTLRNDGCRVWQRGGYRGTPKPGDRFTLCIHKLHGVIAPRRGVPVIVLVCADGRTEKSAIRHLGTALRKLRQQSSA